MKKKVDAVAKSKKAKTPVKKSATKSVAKKTPPKKSAIKPTAKKSAMKSAPKKSPVKKAAAFQVSPKKSGANKSGSVAKVISKSTSLAKPAKAGAAPQIAPLHHRVVVRPEPRQEKTAGGLYIPDSTEHKPLQGTVVAVGLGKVLKKGAIRPMDVQKGDTVLYAPYAGTDVQLEGEQFLILSEDEILGILNA